MKRFLAVMLSIVLVAGIFGACSSTPQTKVDAKDFRVVAYIAVESLEDTSSFNVEHIKEVTDIIFIGAVDYDEKGIIHKKDNYQKGLEFIRSVIGENDVNLYVSIGGPGSQSDSDDWYEQMADLAQRNNNSFRSGVLENNILALLKEDGYDGVFFDYEYAIKKKYWKVYNDFIVSLDNTLGDDYKIGMALAGWDLGQNKAAREATDFIELMSYDLWDDDGTHASIEVMQNDIKACKKAGYDMSKIDMGVPFYARPTDHGGYWYDYYAWYDKLDDKGFVDDKETGLTFSFNTYDTIKQKTSIAMENGCGGMMIWHWACDVEYGNEKSLFKAINDAKTDAINK